MAEKTLIARVGPDEANPGLLLVTSPSVGLIRGVPPPGVYLNRYDAISRIRIMGLDHLLRLPRDAHGWVVDSHVGNELTAVAFDAPLIRIDPSLGRAEADRPSGQVELDPGAASPAEAVIVVKASTDGIFYQRPSPDSAPFVSVGDRVGPGTVLGLIEVMKCFNQITYGGPGLPDHAEVVRVLVEDATEVHFGRPLVWIRPLE